MSQIGNTVKKISTWANSIKSKNPARQQVFKVKFSTQILEFFKVRGSGSSGFKNRSCPQTYRIQLFLLSSLRQHETHLLNRKNKSEKNTCTALARTFLVSSGCTIPSQMALAAVHAALHAANSNSLADFLRGLALSPCGGFSGKASHVGSVCRILINKHDLQQMSKEHKFKQNRRD